MAAAKHLFLLFHPIAMKDNNLPEKIPVPTIYASQAEIEIAKEIGRYNMLPVGHPDRRGIYDKIQDLQEYIKNWD